MTGFWEKRLAPAQPPPRPHVTAGGQQLPWWAYPTGEQQQQLAPSPEQHAAEVAAAGAASKAVSAHLSERCPSPVCRSVNYFAAPGSNAAKKCFDCGYPVQQSGTGTGLPSHLMGEQTATPARQVPTPGFQPQTIVDRIQ